MRAFTLLLLSVVSIAFLAVLGGTILYWIWPFAIPAAFPGAVEAGTLAAELTWVQAVALTWVFNILIKATQSCSSSN